MLKIAPAEVDTEGMRRLGDGVWIAAAAVVGVAAFSLTPALAPVHHRPTPKPATHTPVQLDSASTDGAITVAASTN